MKITHEYIAGTDEIHIVESKKDELCHLAENFRIGDRLIGEICHDSLTKKHFIRLRKEF